MPVAFTRWPRLVFSCALESLEIASSILLLVFHVLVNPLLGADLENFLVVALNKLPQLRLVTSGYCNTTHSTKHQQQQQRFHMPSLSVLFLPFFYPLSLSPFSSRVCMHDFITLRVTLCDSLRPCHRFDYCLNFFFSPSPLSCHFSPEAAFFLFSSLLSLTLSALVRC